MSVRKRNDYRATRRAVSDAARRANRRHSAEAAWLSAVALGMTASR